MAGKHKIDWGPGYRFFSCEECGHQWQEKSRDWTSPSVSDCPNVSDEHVMKIGYYEGGEPHYEWPTDQSGNLIEEE